MTTRRTFVGLIGAAVAWPLAARAQPTVARIGFLRQAGPDDKHFDAFRRGLRAAGYIEGQNIVIEQRYAASWWTEPPRRKRARTRPTPFPLFSRSPSIPSLTV